MRSENVDKAKGCISQTCNRTAVMQEFSNFVSAFPHHLKPLLRDGSQFTCMLFHPRIDSGIPLDAAIESQRVPFSWSFHFLKTRTVSSIPFFRSNELNAASGLEWIMMNAALQFKPSATHGILFQH